MSIAVMVIVIYKIKHYSVPLTEETMAELKEKTQAAQSQEALRRAVEYTLKNAGASAVNWGEY